MLTRFPAWPLIVDYVDKDRELTAEDKEGIQLALQHPDRVRRIGLWVPNSHLRNLVVAIDGEFPVLEHLLIGLQTKHDMRMGGLTLRDTFQAPHLRHLVFIHFPFLVAFPSLTTSVGLVTLSLNFVPRLFPYHVLRQLSSIPCLETLEITLLFHISVHDFEIEMQQWPISVFRRVTLPNLRRFVFKGSTAYLETLLPWMTTPLLERLQITFFSQLTFSVPRLLQYMSTANNLNFSSAEFSFSNGGVTVSGYPREGVSVPVFHMHILCGRFDWQVSSVAQIFDTLSPVLSAVVVLTLDNREHTSSPQHRSKTGATHWRDLLRSFNNVRTLRVHGGLVGSLSHVLRWSGQSPLELLPELKELVCPTGGHAGDALTAFINARKVVGHPVRLVHVDSPDSLPAGTGKSRRSYRSILSAMAMRRRT